MTEPLIIGAMVRTLGAYPSGWRYPGAHRTPQTDAEILRLVAREGEDAGLDYLFFGDWLATGPDLEFRDPYLLARIDPVSAVLFLAGVTSRIGLIATVNTTYADPYATARSLASLDVLTAGERASTSSPGRSPEPRATTVATRTPTTSPATTARRSSSPRCADSGTRGAKTPGSRMPSAASSSTPTGCARPIWTAGRYG